MGSNIIVHIYLLLLARALFRLLVHFQKHIRFCKAQWLFIASFPLHHPATLTLFLRLCLFFRGFCLWGFLSFQLFLVFWLASPSLRWESGPAFLSGALWSLRTRVPSELLQIKVRAGKCFLSGKEQKPINTTEPLSGFFSGSFLQI